jgi:hypothetical protein
MSAYTSNKPKNYIILLETKYYRLKNDNVECFTPFHQS